MKLWLFYRIFVRRHLRSPLRAILLTSALSIATSLWLAVAHVGFVGTQSFEEAVGISPQKFTHQITAVSGRIPQEVMERCIAPLQNTASIAAVQRENGILESGDSSTTVRVFITSSFGEEVVVGTGQDDQIFLSEESLERLSIQNGDKIRCKVAGRIIEGTASALPSNLPKVPGIAVVVPMPLYQKALNLSHSEYSLSGARYNEGFDSIFLGPRVDHENTFSGLQRWLDTCGLERTNESFQSLRVDTTQAIQKKNSSLLNAYRTNIGILALMALAVSTILVAHASQISLLNVMREIAIVRILGVKASFCSFCILLEASLIGIVGVAVAATVGFPITTYLVSYLSGTAYEMYRLPLAQTDSWGFTLALYGGVGVVMIVTTVAGAIISAFRAAAVPLGAAAKREQSARVYVSTNVVTALAIVISVLLFAVGWYGYAGLYGSYSSHAISLQEFQTPVAVTYSAYSFVAIASIFGLIVVPVAVVVVRPLMMATVYKLSPLLKLHSASRHASEHIVPLKPESSTPSDDSDSTNPTHRTLAGTTWTLSDLFSVVCATLAVSLIVSISLMVGSFRETLDIWTTQRLQGDLFLSINLKGVSDREAQIPDALRTTLKSVEGIKEVRNYREIKLTSQGIKVVLGATQVDTFLREGAYRFTEVNTQLMEESSHRILISEGAMRRLRLHLGDRVYVDREKGEIFPVLHDPSVERGSFVIAGVLREYSTELPLFLISDEMFVELFPHEGNQSLTLFTDPSLPLDTIQKRVIESVSSAVAVRKFSELRGYVLDMFDRTFLITGAVRWIVFSLAGVGLLITFLQQVWEQRRTIKVMRTLGYSRLQVAALWGVHACETSIIATVSGIVGGSLVGWGLVYLVNPASFGWSLDFYLTRGSLMISLLFIWVVSSAVFVATWYMVKFVVDGVAISDE